MLDPTLEFLNSLAFAVGKVRVSVLGIIKALIALSVLLWAAGFFSRLAERQIKTVSGLTPSVQVLFGKFLRVALYVLAILIALETVGIDLTTLAVFSGALGLGIGIGLQKIVSNLVSGVILLMDKSVKPGDVIAIGQTYGTINKLSARFVSVITRDGIEHLIPNDELVSQKVENWSHSHSRVRVRIPIGVSYDSDIPKARELAERFRWHIKSTTKAQQGLYEYDAVARLRDSQLGDERVHDISNYIVQGKLWEAFDSDRKPVLLIDEIDKADIEFPNDLLLELDRMEFHVYETKETVKANNRPIVIITSNNEKELPDAFLRRCFFHYIQFPDHETMQRIIDVHYPGIHKRLVREALNVFYNVRDVPGLKKKPSTSELLDWLKLLMVEDMPPETLRESDHKSTLPPFTVSLVSYT